MVANRCRLTNCGSSTRSFDKWNKPGIDTMAKANDNTHDEFVC
jgi:hypothetical protein